MRDRGPLILSRRRALAALLVAAQLPLLVGMAAPETRAEATASSAGASPETAPGLPPNNIVGLNLARLHQPRFIWVAGQIANANGGAWGYVTVLLTRQERDSDFAVQQLIMIIE